MIMSLLYCNYFFYQDYHFIRSNSISISGSSSSKRSTCSTGCSSSTLLCMLNREYVYSVAVYQKYLTRLRELITFEHGRENYYFSQPS